MGSYFLLYILLQKFGKLLKNAHIRSLQSAFVRYVPKTLIYTSNMMIYPGHHNLRKIRFYRFIGMIHIPHEYTVYLIDELNGKWVVYC